MYVPYSCRLNDVVAGTGILLLMPQNNSDIPQMVSPSDRLPDLMSHGRAAPLNLGHRMSIVPTDLIEAPQELRGRGMSVMLDSDHLWKVITIYLYIMSVPSVNTLGIHWKNAKVVPIFKSGVVNDKNNYRPISILPVRSKVQERFVHMHFSTFLEENNLINLVQSGFRHMHSTLTSLINITDRWLRNIDQGFVTDIVFIDLRKAFDTVNFEILLKKLKYYGLSDVELKWFTSYLHGRIDGR